MIDLVRKIKAESESKQYKDIPVKLLNSTLDKKLSVVDLSVLNAIKKFIVCRIDQISEELDSYDTYVGVYIRRLIRVGLVVRSHLPGLKGIQYEYKLSKKMVAML